MLPGTDTIRSPLKRALADSATVGMAHLTQVVKRNLKRIQYYSHLITGCLPTIGLDPDGLTNGPDAHST